MSSFSKNAQTGQGKVLVWIIPYFCLGKRAIFCPTSASKRQTTESTGLFSVITVVRLWILVLTVCFTKLQKSLIVYVKHLNSGT